VVSERKLNWATHEDPASYQSKWYLIGREKIVGVVECVYHDRVLFRVLEGDSFSKEQLDEIAEVVGEFASFAEKRKERVSNDLKSALELMRVEREKCE